MKTLSADPSSWFTCEVNEGVATLRIKDQVFDVITDLGKKQAFFEQLDRLEASPDVRVLLLLNEPGTLDNVAYELFFQKMFGHSQDAFEQGHSKKELAFLREGNAFNQFIQRIYQYTKITISGIQGRIPGVSLGVALACDFRYASDNTTIIMSHSNLSIPSVGALGFFLPRYVGQGKTTELMLAKDEMSSHEAYELGLLSAVFCTENFEQKCIRHAQILAEKSGRAVKETKALISGQSAEMLEEYLAREFNIMQIAWARHNRFEKKE